MNTFCTGDEHAEDECIENVCSNFSRTHAQLATMATSKQALCQEDCYSQVLTFENGRFHTLVLTSEYATPTSYTYTLAFFAGPNGLQVN